MTLAISLVSSPANFTAFIQAPRKLYAGDKRYVAPLDKERRELFDPKLGGFFGHGEVAYFLARRGGEVVGRVSAQIDRLGPPDQGLFGAIDCVDDQAVVSGLLDAARGWLRAKGRTLLRGPFNLSINGEAGLMVEGFDAPPNTLIPWHPPYMKARLEGAGLTLVRNLDSFMHRNVDIDAGLERLRADRAKLDVTVRGLNMRDLKGEAAIGIKLFNSAWAENWGFTPLAPSDMEGFHKGFKPFLDRDCGIFIERKGEPVAFAVFLPNVYEAFGDMGGTLSPWKVAKLLDRLYWHRPFRSVRLCLFGVDGAHRKLLGAQLALLMIKETVVRAHATGLDWLEAGWVLEENRPVTTLLNLYGFQRFRRHAVFEGAL